MPVGPDDEQRDLADAQPVGCGWRKPRARIAIAGPGCEHDGRFDDGRVALGTYGALESRELLDGHR